MSIASPTRYTAEDVLVMSDGKNYELVDGQLVELQMSTVSSWVAGEVYGLIRELTRKRDLGWVFPEGTGFRCFPNDAGMVRRADTSFFVKSRFPDGIPDQGFLTNVPDLVVEVISPHDTAYEVNLKIEDWRTAGVPLLWIIWPVTQTIDVYQHDGVHQLGSDDELTADPLIPGFRCRVKELFPKVAQS
jgi:Uma2 family endonuclease